MPFRIFFAILVTMMLCGLNIAKSGLVINEIMPAPLGDEPEWIELYNGGAALDASDTLCMSDATETLRMLSISLASGKYAVLTRDTLALKSVRNIPDSVLLIEAKIPFLNNDADSLTLSNLSGEVIDSFVYKFSASKKGISLERISPADTAIAYCIAVDSATCGFRNSVTEESNVAAKQIPSSFIITPNPFCGSESSSCVLSFDVRSDVRCLMEIYDINGNALAAGNEFVAYEGKNKVEIGQYFRGLTCGTYLVAVSFLSGNGGKAFAGSCVISVIE